MRGGTASVVLCVLGPLGVVRLWGVLEEWETTPLGHVREPGTLRREWLACTKLMNVAGSVYRAGYSALKGSEHQPAMMLGTSVLGVAASM